jgi:hypothetical protein
MISNVFASIHINFMIQSVIVALKAIAGVVIKVSIPHGCVPVGPDLMNIPPFLKALSKGKK